MPIYQAYSLRIESDIVLPGLPESFGEPDMLIRRQKIDGEGSSSPKPRIFKKVADGFLLIWPQYAKFLIRGGNQILADPNDDCDPNLFIHMLIGPVLNVLLLQRGFSVFHASTIALGGSSISFLARKGHGKSTQAAAFLKRDALLISDDVLAMRYQEERAFALPGLSHIKLWPESMEIVGEAPEDHPKVMNEMDKRSISIPEVSSSRSIPIKALYVLQFGRMIRIQSLNQKEALKQILPHWYGALFQGELLPLLGLDRHFNECIKIIETVPIYLLERPPLLDQLEDVCRSIECHLSEINS